jgi:hypothetical protein
MCSRRRRSGARTSSGAPGAQTARLKGAASTVTMSEEIWARVQAIQSRVPIELWPGRVGAARLGIALHVQFPSVTGESGYAKKMCAVPH